MSPVVSSWLKPNRVPCTCVCSQRFFLPNLTKYSSPLHVHTHRTHVWQIYFVFIFFGHLVWHRCRRRLRAVRASLRLNYLFIFINFLASDTLEWAIQLCMNKHEYLMCMQRTHESATIWEESKHTKWIQFQLDFGQVLFGCAIHWCTGHVEQRIQTVLTFNLTILCGRGDAGVGETIESQINCVWDWELERKLFLFAFIV